MRALLEAYGDESRRVWIADSFQGLPPPDPTRYLQDAGDQHHTHRELAVSLEQVKANFARYGLLDDRVRFLSGWFRDMLPSAPIDRLAVLRVDADMYESTIQVLEAFYDRVSTGGYVIIDDYGGIKQCRDAVHDFRAARNLKTRIVPIDWTGVYWQIPEPGARESANPGGTLP
jgi:O-methyltransferase